MGRLYGVILILLSAASFGAMPVFAHYAGQDGVTLHSMLFYRFFIALIVMIPVALMQQQVFPRGKDLAILVAMGMIGYAGQSYCYFTALTLIPASLVTTLLYLYPVIVALASVFIFKEKLTRNKVLALVLAISGTLMVVGMAAGSNIKGIFLGILASVIYSVYIITGDRVIKRNPVFPATIVIIGSTSVVYLAAGLKAGFSLPVSLGGGASILSIALVSTFLAIYAFFAGVKHTGPVNASMLSTFEPVTTVCLSYLVFDQALGPQQALGIALVLASAIMIALETPAAA